MNGSGGVINNSGLSVLRVASHHQVSQNPAISLIKKGLYSGGILIMLFIENRRLLPSSLSSQRQDSCFIIQTWYHLHFIVVEIIAIREKIEIIMSNET